MEGVVTKVRRDLSWDVCIRVAKRLPHPGWRIGREADSGINEIIDSMEEQLYEDATWKG